jgi:hypothetical protein
MSGVSGGAVAFWLLIPVLATLACRLLRRL